MGNIQDQNCSIPLIYTSMLNSSRQSNEWWWSRAEAELSRGDVVECEFMGTIKALEMNDDEIEQTAGVCNTVEIYTLK